MILIRMDFYLRMLFDISNIAYEDINYQFLLEEFIGRTATKITHRSIG